MLSIFTSVGSSLLSLLATLIDLSNADGVLSRLRTLFIVFNPPNFSLNVFGAKNSLVRLLVRYCYCLLPSGKRNSVLPVFNFFFFFFFDIKSIQVCKAWMTCHIQVPV